MRQLLCVGLAAAAAGSGGRVAADPAAPQISPLHRQREDARRLTEQQRSLERPAPREAVSAPAANPAPPVPSGGTRHTTRNAGLVLLGIAGASAIIALPLRSFSTPNPGEGQSASDSLSDLLLVASAITATGGIVLVLSDRSVAVTPAVTLHAVGVTIMGQL
jgi:hypothetical protein